MDASIVITTYDRPLFLKRAIESCLNQQTSYSYEIIVIDDNGLDTAIQKVTAELLKNYPEIVYIPLEKNSGACTARNVGVENAKGEYIFFLDDDDEFSPNKIQSQICFLEQNKEFDGCLAAFKRLDQSNNQEIIAESNYPKVGTLKDFVISGNFFTPMLCIRKEVFKNIGGFDKIPRFQDRFFMLKALSNDYRFGIIEAQLHIMYEHTEDRITNKGIKSTLTSLDIIKNYIELNKSLFNKKEWEMYLVKDYRMRGTTFYISNRYFQRINAIPFYFKSFLISKEKKDIIMLLKTIIKFS